ncbi:MAG: hypothetical protein K8S16_01865 [Bacteroidales bacterium]|nr:hypothetical protein [Bacteroidales bacterium]
MKKTFYVTKIIPRIFLLLLIGMIAFGSGGCKSKKKLAQEAAAMEYADKVEKAIAELTAILNDDGTMPVSEKERRLNNIKSQNLNDTRVNDLIAQVEAKIAAEKEALRLKEEEEKERKKQQAEEQTRYFYIEEYFSQIANAQSVDEANARISETKKLFASDDVPVLIIISKTADGVDYDKPTTLDKYLNYLKDTKKSLNNVEDVKIDGYGQITVIELIKK